MKQKTILYSLFSILACIVLAHDATAQDPSPSPTPSPTPAASTAEAAASPTPSPAQTATPAPAAAQAWLLAESTAAGVAPGADPASTILRSRAQPVVIKQGQNYIIVFSW